MSDLIIDAGHGGNDSGTYLGKILEKDITLKISKYQLKRFKELGITTLITRDKDMTLESGDRTRIVKLSKAKLCISNHINSGGGDGAETIYSIYSKSTLADSILAELKKAGQNIRRSYTKTLPNNSKQDYYYMHRETGSVETIIVEYAFLDSKGDDLSQITNDWEKYAEAVVKAVCAYMRRKYIAPKASNPTETIYRVVVGSYKDKKNAEACLKKAKKQFPDAFLTVK